MFEKVIDWWNEPAVSHLWGGLRSTGGPLDRILPYAPLIAATTAIIAGCIALAAIRTQKSIARKRGAIDFFLKTDMDKAMIDAHALFESAVIAFAEHLRDQNNTVETFCKTPEYKNVRAYLNIHELVAVGVKNKVFDETVCYNFWSDALIQHSREADRLIKHWSEKEGGEASYLELRKLNVKWKKRTERWQKKEQKRRARAKLPFLRRQLSRLGIVSLVTKPAAALPARDSTAHNPALPASEPQAEIPRSPVPPVGPG
jgi:hypothetical protein